MPFKPGQSGNPSGRPPQSVRSAKRTDGWSNILTGLGTRRDKRTASKFYTDPVTDLEARDLWRGDDLAAHVIETYPDEMLRAGFCINIADDNDDGEAARDLSEDMDASLEDLNFNETYRTALCYERAYGGAAIFPVTNDLVGDLAQPLNLNRIVDVKRLVTFEPRELQPISYYNDPTGEKYGMPAVYRLQPITVSGAAPSSGTIIHESRLVVFPGIRVSRQQVSPLAGWGDSVLTRVRDTLRDFNMGFGSASHLLADFAQAVYVIQGLADAVASDEGAEIMKRRMEIMDLCRSTLRGILLDAGDATHSPESFDRKATPISGVPELLDRLMQRLAAAADEPVARLMGISPGGLNSTGTSEMQWFYDKVSQRQDKHLRPRANQVIKMLFLSKSGPSRGIEPDKWTIEFNPLWSPSEKEQVDTRKVQADIDAIYLDRQVVSPDDIVRSRFGGDGYSFDTKIDLQAHAAMMQAEEDRANQMAAAAAQAKVTPGDPKADVPADEPADGEAKD